MEKHLRVLTKDLFSLQNIHVHCAPYSAEYRAEWSEPTPQSCLSTITHWTFTIFWELITTANKGGQLWSTCFLYNLFDGFSSKTAVVTIWRAASVSLSPSTDCPNREAEEAAIGIEAENNTEVLLKGLFSYISSQRTAKENVHTSLSDTGSLVTIVTEKAEEPNPPPPAPISLLSSALQPPSTQLQEQNLWEHSTIHCQGR